MNCNADEAECGPVTMATREHSGRSAVRDVGHRGAVRNRHGAEGDRTSASARWADLYV